MSRFCSVLIFVFLAISLAEAASDCILNDDSSREELLSFLRASQMQTREQQDAECITFAVKRLEYQPASQEAIALLISYLDFARPLSDAEREGFMIHGPLNLPGNRYPAINTLLSYGKRVLPALLSTIKSSSSPTVDQNATYTLMELFRDEPEKGIEALTREASHSQPPIATKLRNAAKFAIHWCGQQSHQKCERALADKVE